MNLDILIQLSQIQRITWEITVVINNDTIKTFLVKLTLRQCLKLWVNYIIISKVQEIFKIKPIIIINLVNNCFNSKIWTNLQNKAEEEVINKIIFSNFNNNNQIKIKFLKANSKINNNNRSRAKIIQD